MFPLTRRVIKENFVLCRPLGLYWKVQESLKTVNITAALCEVCSFSPVAVVVVLVVLLLLRKLLILSYLFQGNGQLLDGVELIFRSTIFFSIYSLLYLMRKKKNNIFFIFSVSFWLSHLYDVSIMWPTETEVIVSQLCLMCGST